MTRASTNRKQRRTQNTSKITAKNYAAVAQAAQRQGDVRKALEGYMQAVKAAPENRAYKVQLCEVIARVSFGSFNLSAKKIILACLQTPGLDYQALWKPWFSLLMCDPGMQPFQELINRGEVTSPKKLQVCLSDPYFLAGLTNLMVFDMRFEQALQKLQNLDGPQGVKEALALYHEKTEYVFCAQSQEEYLYPVDESIEMLSAPQGATSEEVRAQYEKNPYPRWTSCHHRAPVTQKAHDHLFAGCGTGYGLCQTAMMYPKAKITAIDLSRASLSYAKQKAQELNLTNITFYQADILDLKKLDRRFDVIECSGVLHHMQDPLVGWKSLIGKLKPEGRMRIGLYSALGRVDVVAAREVIAQEGFEATHDGIKAAREAIATLPSDHPARRVLTRRDFYAKSSCRDLLFHVQEHRFTIQDVLQALEKLDVVFDGFDLQDRSILQSYHDLFPQDQKAQNLKNWETFEEKNPETFRGMYQFWCRLK